MIAPRRLPDFCAEVARLLGAEPTEVGPDARLRRDLRVGEIALFYLVTRLQMENPSVHLPEQMDVHDLTVRDLHHLLVSLTADHLPRGHP